MHLITLRKYFLKKLLSQIIFQVKTIAPQKFGIHRGFDNASLGAFWMNLINAEKGRQHVESL